MAGKFEIFKEQMLYKFRLTDDNDAVLAVSPGYGTKKEAAAAIMGVRENAAAGHIVDTSVIDELTAEKSVPAVSLPMVSAPAPHAVREYHFPPRRRAVLVAPQL